MVKWIPKTYLAKTAEVDGIYGIRYLGCHPDPPIPFRIISTARLVRNDRAGHLGHETDVAESLCEDTFHNKDVTS